MTAHWHPELVSDELLDLTHILGEPDRKLAILAEGNTSERLPDGRLIVKSSGASLAAATRDDFVTIDVEEIAAILQDSAADQRSLTEALDAGVQGGAHRRASIESLMHAAIQAVAPAKFIGHTHPTAVLSLVSSIHAAVAYDSPAYSDEAVVIGHPLFVPYAQPGIALGRAVYEALRRRVDEEGDAPSLILLGNHGIVAVGPSASAVHGVTEMAVKAAEVRLGALSVGGLVPVPAESIKTFFAREDIAERRRDLNGVL
jgi:rhamnose utilization protein RhaD (predicted bifunctional aldolase and dehydrogenase)